LILMIRIPIFLLNVMVSIRIQVSGKHEKSIFKKQPSPCLFTCFINIRREFSGITNPGNRARLLINRDLLTLDLRLR
jgi:hypothetical protein